jgi:anti-sigma regulatory factor (Ser/Thr protein kinase)
VATVARRFNGAGSEIGLALADDLAAAWADPLRVRQAIRNLVSNAIRYGGPVVSITTRQTGDAIQISVLDNGDGVPKEDEASIFLPYRRSTTGRRDPSSIGLGLWICRQLAQAMGGHLVYERRDGSTEFVMTVPVARPDENPTRAPASAHIPVPFTLSLEARDSPTKSAAMPVTAPSRSQAVDTMVSPYFCERFAGLPCDGVLRQLR